MSPKSWCRSANILIYQCFISAFYVACGIHSITAIWLAYDFTQSPFIVSLMIVASYLPSAIAGFTLSERFSCGNPFKKLKTGVLILAGSMVLMVAALTSIAEGEVMSLVVIGLIQVVLSLVKLSNQSSLAVLVRTIFSKQQGKQVIEMASSNLLVSLSIGAGLAGLLLTIDLIYIGPVLACILFAFAWMGMVKLERRTSEFSLESPSVDVGSQTNSVDKVSLFTDRNLQTLILFSICSSGTLQYINAILAPLANHIVANEPSYFSLLDVLSMVGGFLAGVVLSSNRLKSTLVLDHGLLAIAAITVSLAVSSHPALVAILMFMLAFITTAHVISMQVKTNQAPHKEHVSQYTVLRNASVSVAKTCFSLLAGIVTTVVDIQTSWFVLTVIAVCFALLWRVFPPSWREDSSHLKESYQE
ncbi:MFS transporter [Vibrio mediterranei]